MPGMPALAKHLVDTIVPGPSNEAIWEKFRREIEVNADLESALHAVGLPPELMQEVVRKTWTLLNPVDIEVFRRSVSEPDFFPLGRLFRHMLQSTQSSLNVITTNYDRLAEYSCEQEGIHHYTGFSHGYRRTMVGPAFITSARQVNVWKVHGSLDWFVTEQGEIYGYGNLPGQMDGVRPLVVTPGIEKYRNTHKEPFKTIIHRADDVIDEAASYLCVGFGFNDEHIQEKLINRCAKKAAPVIVITRDLTEAAKKFLFERGLKNYLAIERASNESSRVYSSVVGEAVVPGNIWSLEGFIKLIM